MSSKGVEIDYDNAVKYLGVYLYTTLHKKT